MKNVILDQRDFTHWDAVVKNKWPTKSPVTHSGRVLLGHSVKEKKLGL